jgi:hypothetical protein
MECACALATLLCLFLGYKTTSLTSFPFPRLGPAKIIQSCVFNLQSVLCVCLLQIVTNRCFLSQFPVNFSLCVSVGNLKFFKNLPAVHLPRACAQLSGSLWARRVSIVTSFTCKCSRTIQYTLSESQCQKPLSWIQINRNPDLDPDPDFLMTSIGEKLQLGSESSRYRYTFF